MLGLDCQIQAARRIWQSGGSRVAETMINASLVGNLTQKPKVVSDVHHEPQIAFVPGRVRAIRGLWKVAEISTWPKVS